MTKETPVQAPPAPSPKDSKIHPRPVRFSDWASI